MSMRPNFVTATSLAFSLLLVTALQAQDRLLADGIRAPDFTSKDVNGRDVRTSDYTGKVVVLDFWATWCTPCLQSLPHVQEIAKSHRDAGVVVLAVCTSDSRARFDAWVETNAARYPDVVFTCDPHDRGSDSFDERASKKLYHVSGLPTKFVIGRDGKVAMGIVGSEKDDVRLEAGLARAGIAIDAAVARAGEAMAAKITKEEAARAAAARMAPSFFPSAGKMKSGDEVPDLTLQRADGTEFALSSLRGKPIVLAV
ncbi:MAG TPA: redoxin domain-containing protein, partial [Acidimicrobiia bacterium]|nr:redoxin domain-containing protein [Acidimicrobiia bacterium]